MLRIRLVGPPALERDGEPVRPPRGHKTWALLTYVLLADRPLGRRHLAETLFGDADDPLGALRWTLGELRRALGDAQLLRGDPVAVDLGGDIVVDLQQATGDVVDTAALLDLRGELLEGIDPSSGQAFESWLLVERHRLSAAIEARLRRTAVAMLTTGRAADAVPYAARAVACNPLEEGNHELLVRSLAMAGDRSAALQQIAVCEDTLRRELGTEASAALRDAADTEPATSMVPPVGGRASAESQLDAGRAAIAAGAVDAGVQCLRRAVSEAIRSDDDALRARALLALGGALIHATRGRDEEGAVVLHEAIELATKAGDRASAVTAHRELGYVEVQAGRRATADDWLQQAQALAETDDELAPILGVRGMNASDRADYPTAFEHLRASVDRAERADDERQQAWSLSLLGRAHLLRGEYSQAAGALSRTLALARNQRWVAFIPWPLALQSDLELATGDLDGAAEHLENAWSLACQLTDPCWESMAARGLGLLGARRGEHDVAAAWMTEAVVRSNRTADRYQWVHAHALDAMITVALENDEPDRAAPLVTTLETLAARCDMRELVVRAHVHRARTGDRRAIASARLLGADIDNPALHALVDE
jgi:DNA-binding SARP family transcriptional activator